MSKSNATTGAMVRRRADQPRNEVDAATRKEDDMARGTGLHDSQQIKGTGRGNDLIEGLRSRAVPTAHAGDPRLDQVPLKLIRFQTVRDRTGLSRSTIWRLQRTGAFPKHHRISANAVAWVEQDVVDWMRAKASAR
jgi:prophage regulatory protein